LDARPAEIELLLAELVVEVRGLVVRDQLHRDVQLCATHGAPRAGWRVLGVAQADQLHLEVRVDPETTKAPVAADEWMAADRRTRRGHHGRRPSGATDSVSPGL
jgi:hypothetical protein